MRAREEVSAFQEGESAVILLRLRSSIWRYVTRGVATGREYVFREAWPVAVDPADAPEMLSRARRQGCCGRPVESVPIFERLA